jgi:ABC-type multidrug transport system fused ATPase/permease subunit
MVVSLAIIISLSWLEEWGSLAFHRQGFFVRNIRGPVLGVSRMVPVAVGLLAFGLALAGILLGSVIRTLPKAELSSDSKEVVKLSLGVLATLAALVLGLLVAGAKTTYSARESEINQITADVILLDSLLAKYGEGAQAARASLRQAISPMVDQIWREHSAPQSAPFKATAEAEAFYQQVQQLQPSNDIQRGLKQRISEVTLDLAQARLLLFSHLGSSIPFPFLAVLLLWMTILFAGFSLMAPANTITLAALVVCALSVSAAIFLILGLDQPFSGLMMIQSERLINALPPLSG